MFSKKSAPNQHTESVFNVWSLGGGGTRTSSHLLLHSKKNPKNPHTIAYENDCGKERRKTEESGTDLIFAMQALKSDKWLRPKLLNHCVSSINVLRLPHMSSVQQGQRKSSVQSMGIVFSEIYRCMPHYNQFKCSCPSCSFQRKIVPHDARSIYFYPTLLPKTSRWHRCFSTTTTTLWEADGELLSSQRSPNELHDY